MGETTGIAWTDHTFNAWIGCAKVSPACKNCYAEKLDAHRFGGTHWGVDAERKMLSQAYWKQPLRWDADALHSGMRRRVFCSSLADVFEDRDDLLASRARLYELIERTPNLDWLLLTKRPENLARLYPTAWKQVVPHNVWLGTTVESQEYAEERLPHLLAVPAVVHFVSAEPLLGSLDIERWLPIQETSEGLERFDPAVDWVITGCESGPGRRDSQSDWYRSLRDQCSRAGAAFFFKQARYEPPESPVPIGSARFVAHSQGSWTKKDGTIEQPYLDGRQHIEFPVPRWQQV